MGSGRVAVCVVAVVLLFAAVPAIHADVNWPASNAGWHILTMNGGVYADPNDQATAEVDIRGGVDSNANEYSGGYWYYDGIDLMFRMRIDAAPTDPQMVWQILLDTDGDDGVEFALQADYSARDRVEFQPTTAPGPPFTAVAIETDVHAL